MCLVIGARFWSAASPLPLFPFATQPTNSSSRRFAKFKTFMRSAALPRLTQTRKTRNGRAKPTKPRSRSFHSSRYPVHAGRLVRGPEQLQLAWRLFFDRNIFLLRQVSHKGDSLTLPILPKLQRFLVFACPRSRNTKSPLTNSAVFSAQWWTFSGLPCAPKR